MKGCVRDVLGVNKTNTGRGGGRTRDEVFWAVDYNGDDGGGGGAVL